MKTRFLHSIIYLAVGLMALLIANNALFLHSHYLSDGRVVTHAHPFNKSAGSIPLSSHEHTKAELLFLENLQQLFYLVFISFIAFSFLKLRAQLFFKKLFIPRRFNFPHAGRAPPFC